MAMSTRTRTKHGRKAQELLRGTRVSTYVVGRGGPNPVLAGVVLLAVFVGITLAVFLATGAIIVPGVLVFLLLQHGISPPRALVLTDRGFALAHRSLLNGQPTRVLGEVPPDGVAPSKQEAGYVRLDLAGGDHIWLSRKEEARLRVAVAHPA